MEIKNSITVQLIAWINDFYTFLHFDTNEKWFSSFFIHHIAIFHNFYFTFFRYFCPFSRFHCYASNCCWCSSLFNHSIPLPSLQQYNARQANERPNIPKPVSSIISSNHIHIWVKRKDVCTLRIMECIYVQQSNVGVESWSGRGCKRNNIFKGI